MPTNLHINEALQKEPVVVLTRYLEGNLSSEEIAQVEQVMAEDPFMADALEGLRSMPEPARAQAIGQELRFNAHKLLRAKRSVVSLFQFNQYATAAVAVLVILFVATAAILLTSRMQGNDSPEAITQVLPEKQVTAPAQPAEDVEASGEEITLTPDLQPVQPAEEKEELIAERPAPPTPAQQQAMDQKREQESQRSTRQSDLNRRRELAMAEKERMVRDDEKITEAESASGAPASEIVESMTDLPADPTLSKDQLDKYREAFTQAEEAAYQKALEAFDKKLIAGTVEVAEVAKVQPKRTQQTSVQVEEVLADRQKKRRNRNSDKNSNNGGRASKPDTSLPGKSQPQTAPPPKSPVAKEEVDREQANEATIAEEDASEGIPLPGEEELQKALYANPTSGAAWLNLGKYYVGEGKSFKAERYLKVASRSPIPAISQEANVLLKKIRTSKSDN